MGVCQYIQEVERDPTRKKRCAACDSRTCCSADCKLRLFCLFSAPSSYLEAQQNGRTSFFGVGKVPRFIQRASILGTVRSHPTPGGDIEQRSPGGNTINLSTVNTQLCQA